jgi:hypothetical protein
LAEHWGSHGILSGHLRWELRNSALPGKFWLGTKRDECARDMNLVGVCSDVPDASVHSVWNFFHRLNDCCFRVKASLLCRGTVQQRLFVKLHFKQSAQFTEE